MQSSTSPTLSDGVASWSSPIAVSPRDGKLWVVNPDTGSVSVLNTKPLVKETEIAVGEEPWSLVIAPDGQQVYVADQAGGNLVVIDALTQAVQTSVPLGSEIGAIALNPTGSRLYLTLTTANQVVMLDTANLQVLKRVPVETDPYALAISDDGDTNLGDEKLYVTHFTARPRPGGEEARDDGRQGQVTILDSTTMSITHELILDPNAHGFPNLLAGIALTDERGWIPHVRAAPDLPNSLTTTVFAAVSVLDLALSNEAPTAFLPLNDQEIFGSPVNNPVAAIPDQAGERLYVVLAGSDLVEVIDIAIPSQPRLVRFLPVGKNPRGLALSLDEQQAYVMNYLSRSVTALDLETLTPLDEITVTEETLAPEIWQGKVLFHNAVDPRLSQGSWISCASCHPDGRSDSVTWMFPDGPRQSPPLWESAQTLPWHWSAALDELQDVEETIHIIQHGLGLAPGSDPPLLGTPNAGRSVDLDALAIFMAQGIRVPHPAPSNDDLKTGRELFQSAGCTACHGGPTWTSSALPGTAGTLDPDGNGMVDEVLQDVGTYNPRDIRGEMGFDPPSLLSVGLTPPYLHDGSQPTLEALLDFGHPTPQGNGNNLNETEIRVLADFLRSIGPNTAPIDQP